VPPLFFFCGLISLLFFRWRSHEKISNGFLCVLYLASVAKASTRIDIGNDVAIIGDEISVGLV
jgi:hypothetical protein